MTDKQHAYDPDLPYVVVTEGNELEARFRLEVEADFYAGCHTSLRVIDTTPAPRVPEDAQFIMYPGILPTRYFAFREGVEWCDVFGEFHDTLENLPGVTPDTEFTVLDAREERKG